MIPLSSRKDAEKAISFARGGGPRLRDRDDSESDSDGDGDGDLGDISDDDGSDHENNDNDTGAERARSGIQTPTEIGSLPPSPQQRPRHLGGGTGSASGSNSSIAEDVFGRRVRFGRFAANWLSRKTLGLPGFGTMEQESTSDIPLGDLNIKAIAEGSGDGDGEGVDGGIDEASSPVDGKTQGQSSDQTIELMPKLLRYTKLLFSSQNFFFAYDYDLSRQVTAQEPRRNHLPLHRMVDPLVRLFLVL